MEFGAISNIYLLIFLPLISSLFCQIFYKKRAPFFIAFLSSVLVFFLTIKIFPSVLAQGKISNDFELSRLSLALEFKLDLLGAIFLLLIVFLKIVISFFYSSDIERFLDERNNCIFYSVFLLNLFALIGIFTSNNLLNLFLFFEIYSLSSFAISSISRDYDLLKLNFRYFCLNAASALLILFCFFAIYLTFGEVNFDKIANILTLISSYKPIFLITIFLLLAISFTIKFFPFWLYFDKLKSSNSLANFLGAESLFVRTSLGIFVTLKFIYFFFGNKLLFVDFAESSIVLAPIFVLISWVIIFYSCFKIYKQKHLEIIVIYLCLNNLGFILGAIALQNMGSLQALFFYLLNFNLVNLFIFIFATFLKRRFGTSSINRIYLIQKNHFLLILPLKLLIFFIAAFPLTILFFANWHLAYASLSLSFEGFMLIALLVANFVSIQLAVKLTSAFFRTPADEDYFSMPQLTFRKYQFYFLSFWFLITTIYSVALASKFSNGLAFKFANYLLNGI